MEQTNPIHSPGIERRLRQVMLSSAFTPEERALVLSKVPFLTEERMKDAVRWAVGRAKDHDRYSAPLINRIASLTEKIKYRLEEFEANPHKPIRPILSKKQMEESERRSKMKMAA